jgi:hypothetical protein
MATSDLVMVLAKGAPFCPWRQRCAVLIVDHIVNGRKTKVASTTVSRWIINGIFTQEVNG